MANVPLQLSTVKPDFESLVMQLQVFLSSKGTWADLLTSSTGETLVEMMAAVGTFNQFAIESASREAFLHTSVRDSSIYAITRMLGVRIARKAPALVQCSVSRGGDTSMPLAIKKYTQFTVNGVPFFNRDSIFYSSGQAVNTEVVLYEGRVSVETFAADSASFKQIYLAPTGFTVSNFDVLVEIIDSTTGMAEAWEPISEGIWTAGAFDKVYYDSTSGLGEAILAFGDGYHGSLPSIGTNIRVTYAITSGSVGNNGGALLVVKASSMPTLEGETTTSISGGANEKPAMYYKSLAPHLYKARTRAVTPMDYRAIITSYPSVASAAIQTQKDIAPNDLRWMNTVRVCILPTDPSVDAFTPDEWAAFSVWFSKTTHAAIQIQTFNPLKLVRDVSLTLALKSSAIAGEVIPKVDTSVRELFKREIFTLGKRIAVSDIIRAATVEGVDYVDIITPTTDLVTPEDSMKTLYYFALGELQIGAKYSERMYYNTNSGTVS